MKIKPPWFFCCGWWSPWCLLDEYAHRMGLPLSSSKDFWLCRRPDAAVYRHYERTTERIVIGSERTP